MNNNDLIKVINNISNTDSKEYDVKKYNFLNDTSGFSLFLFYHSHFTNNETLYNQAINLLEETIMDYHQAEIPPASVAKMGWLLLHLDKADIVESDVNEMIGDIDDFLFKKTLEYINANNYDFLHGALGIVLYFLSKNEETTRNFVSQFIDEFEKKAEKTGNKGLKWLSTRDYKTQKEEYNISMSHGIASIIAMLSKIYIQGINKQKTKFLIKGAMNYLLQQKLPKGAFNSIFPNLALESMDKLHSSRLAWCYGDLGISVAIWYASQAISRKDWEEEAINILLHSAKRRDLKENGVVDAGLCHGTAGIAHIFNRMYGYTGIEALKDASEYWFDQTLKMARFEDGLAGYKAWQGNERGWVNEPGFLEGIAGIGLAMISAVSDIEPAWDECLLLS